ncbi:MAG: radical SAM protein [Candidatus Thorarchaeota archaeon]|nr:radical SAM protein [Candidatus Thorarchaeota archaeon]
MIRITQLIHGRGTVSQVIKSRDISPREMPSKLLAFTQLHKPLVFWNITNRCNLSCRQCYLNAGSKAQRKEELPLEEAKAFLDDLAEMDIPLLMFSGGEPLLRTDFWDLAAYAKANQIKTALSSNGTLITRRVAEKIKEAGIEYVGISLDGSNEKTHDTIRGQPGSFNRSVKALKNCVKKELKCGVRVTATRDNYHEIPDLLDLAIQLNVPRFCLYWLVPSGRGKSLFDDKNLKTSEVLQILKVLYTRAKELDPKKIEILTVDAPQDGIYILNRLQEENLPQYEDALKLLQFTGDSCSAGKRIANVDPSGDIYVCQFAQLPQLRVGNIRQQKFSEIWEADTNPILSAFRNKVKNLKGKCGKCAYKQLCGGGCRIRAYFQHGDLWAEDPLCPYNCVRTLPDEVCKDKG